MHRSRYPREHAPAGSPSAGPVRTRSQIGADGQPIIYLARRLLPLPDQIAGQSLYTVQPGDRIDLVAARLLGDPLLYWLIADANGAMDPTELCRVAGRKLRVPAPLGQGQAVIDQPKAIGSTSAPALASHTADEAED